MRQKSQITRNNRDFLYIWRGVGFIDENDLIKSEKKMKIK